MSDFVNLDLDRPRRTGTPEVVYGAGKTAAQIATILYRIHRSGQIALATRVDALKAEAVLAELAAQAPGVAVRHHADAAMLEIRPEAEARAEPVGSVLVISAGTSDLPVAAEAVAVAEALGNRVSLIQDVGIAGLHRILSHLDRLRAARVIIVAAGMDGALPAVVAGLVAAPVIGLPTSVGYGAALNGIAPLLTMLNACAPGVAVVNIDNGFGAAMLADRINRGLP